MTFLKRNSVFPEITEWLNENVGKFDSDWYWDSGDLQAQGVIFVRVEDATAFKLRFKF